jgi:hypothetical protein
MLGTLAESTKERLVSLAVTPRGRDIANSTLTVTQQLEHTLQRLAEAPKKSLLASHTHDARLCIRSSLSAHCTIECVPLINMTEMNVSESIINSSSTVTAMGSKDTTTDDTCIDVFRHTPVRFVHVQGCLSPWSLAAGLSLHSHARPMQSVCMSTDGFINTMKRATGDHHSWPKLCQLLATLPVNQDTHEPCPYC